MLRVGLCGGVRWPGALLRGFGMSYELITRRLVICDKTEVQFVGHEQVWADRWVWADMWVDIWDQLGRYVGGYLGSVGQVCGYGML